MANFTCITWRIHIMKSIFLLLLGFLAVSINTAIAEELPSEEALVEQSSSNDEYYKKYCSEMAEQSGIENDEELRQFVKDCLESYIGPASE